MALKVIGAGFGRTGTLSLKIALEQLGFGPCHHMVEVFAHPEQRDFWRRAAEGEAVDWEEALGAYGASVDWPSCHFYRQLADRYPDAKLILTVRDPKQWYESMQATVLKALAMQLAEPDPERRAEWRFIDLILAEQTLGHDYSEVNAIAALERHVASVRRAIRPDRLLEYEVGEGWAKLCGFLNIPIPQSEFPRTNSREEFWNHTS